MAKVSFEIPFSEREEVFYTKEAIINTCKNTTNIPIITYNSDGSSKVVGIVQNIKFENEKYLVEGLLFFCDIEKIIIGENIMSSSVVIGSLKKRGLGYGNKS